jgi:hypothetical protein
MKRLLLARPDVWVSLPVFIVSMAGAISGTAACAWYLTGRGSMCEILPVVSVSAVCVAPIPWVFRHRIQNGRRATVVLVAFAVFTAATGIWCRLGALRLG